MATVSGDVGYLKPGKKIWHPSKGVLVTVKNIYTSGPGLDTDEIIHCWCDGRWCDERNYRVDFVEDVPGVSFCHRHFDFD